MSKYLSLSLRRCSAIGAVLLSACATQTPLEEAPPAPQAEVKEPAAPAYVSDKVFDAETLYALLVAEIAGTRDRFDITVSNYVQQALATRDPGVTARAARIARLLNAHEAALEMALQWLELEPDNPEAHFIAGAELAYAGRLEEAVEHSAVLVEYGDTGFFEAIAAGAIQKDDPETLEQLRQRYAELTQQYPDNASLHLGQSLLLHAAGDLEPALAAARRAKALDPSTHQPALQELRVLQQMGRDQEAQQGMAQLVKQYPEDQRLRLQYARMLAQSDLATAQEQFSTLVQQSPGDPDFILSLGLIQLERGMLVEAKEQFEALLDGQHRDSAHYYLGQIAASRGDPQQALSHYQQVGAGSQYLAATMEAVDVMAELGNMQEALDYLRDEREQVPPTFQDSLYLLEAELYSAQGKTDDALTVLNAGLTHFPESERLLYARAMVYAQQDKLAQAEQDFKQLLENSPNNAAALNALGYTLADRTNRLHEAYGYIKAALQAEPDDAAILDSMGWVLYRMGDREQAIEYLREAMARLPDDEIAAHLGEVLWVSGNQEEAREAWQKGFEANPGSMLIRDTMERLGADRGGI